MIKAELAEAVKLRISDKIHHHENLIAETRASSSETKSSMGDKYETGREMLQQEINNLQRQLNETINQQNSVQKLNDKANASADFGALAETENGLFYIAASVGEINFQTKKIITISPESPLAKTMQGKKAGESFLLNNLSQTIKNIW